MSNSAMMSFPFPVARLGDTRLNERLTQLLQDLMNHPGYSIPQACGSQWAKTKAAYRFLGNPRVTYTQILLPDRSQCFEQINKRGFPLVLAIQDTTSILINDPDRSIGLGKVGSTSKKAVGFYVHSTLGVTPAGEVLGILDQKIWTRTPSSISKSFGESKESTKWLQALPMLRSEREKNASSPTQLVLVADREADIFEFYETAQDHGLSFCIRARRDRILRHPEHPRHLYLLEWFWEIPAAGTFKLDVPKKKASPKYKQKSRESVRSIELQVSFTEFPLTSRGKTMTCYAVYIREPNPPETEDAIEWLLFTNVPVKTLEDAIERAQWYAQRWKIELFHKILKSGCRIEHSRLEQIQSLENLISLSSLVASRLLKLTYLNRSAPESQCTQVLTESQWKALYCKNHRVASVPESIPIPSIRQTTIWIAQLGGYLNRKSDPPPGIQLMWKGWQRLADITEAYEIFHPLPLTSESHAP